MNPISRAPTGPCVAALTRYARFCVVGGSGVLVDMAVLALLAVGLGWNLSLSKVLAAEMAVFNNFLWNDCWTFRALTEQQSRWSIRWARLLRFNLICVAGIVWSVLLLNVQVRGLHWNVYLANGIAIVVVSVWNFLLSYRFTWGGNPALSTARKL
jgi:dolichol-phosphate mannosyltransferase